MKVALSVDALAPVLTGIGRYAWELTTRLPRHPDVRAVGFYRQGRWIADPGLLLQPASLHQRQMFSRRGLKMPRWIRKHLLKWDCSGRVFHGPNYFLPPCVDSAVATVHDLSVFKFPETHPIERIRQFERELKGSLSRAAHLITDTETTRQEVIEFFSWPADSITSVPLGVSSTFAPKSSVEVSYHLAKYGLTAGTYALCVSTLEPRKKIDNLLQAYKRLPAKLRNEHPLVLVGGAGWLSELLHQEIDRLSAQGWLHYLGFIPEADLPMLYAGARTFIYPSSYEGFGLPVLEAMASGVPVISSNRSTLPEVTKGAALLVDPDDVNGLSECISAGLADEEWRAKAASLGLTVASGYSWDQCIEQTVRVYKRIAH